MRKTYKHEIINSNLSREEVISIIQSDFSKFFEHRFTRCADKLSKTNFRNGETEAYFSLIAKSGQKYNFCAYRVFNEYGKEEFYFGILIYIVSHENFGLSYYTFSFGKNNNIFNLKESDVEINRYTEHAISRYVERNGYELYGKKAFIKFFKDTYLFDTIEIGDEEVIAKTTNGALVGRKVNGINHFNTFYNDDMMLSNRRFRDAYINSNLVDDEKFERTKSSLSSIIKFFEQGKIKVTTFMNRMDILRNEITDEYLEYAETTREAFDERLRKLVEKNTICADTAPGNTHIPSRKTNTCIPSCISRFQKGMQADKGIIRWGFQNYLNSKSV